MVTVTTQGGPMDVEILDSTHLRFRLSAEYKWSWALHYAQVSEEIMAQLIKLGVADKRHFIVEAS